MQLAELALLPVLPCLILAPVVIVGLGVVLPLWIGALALFALTFVVVWPLDRLLRLVGVGWLSPSRAWLARALHWLTHPTLPERWRKRR